MGLPRAVLPGRVYMVTRRCLERRFFLRPDPEMTQAFVYCLAAAARRTNVRVIFSSMQSNHHHTGVIDVDGRLPEFLEYLHKFVAKFGNALRGRWESFWAPEQTSCVQLVGPDDILDKMVYAITNPVKDHRVERVSHWPGLDCLAAIDVNVPLVADRPRHFSTDMLRSLATLGVANARKLAGAGGCSADCAPCRRDGALQRAADDLRCCAVSSGTSQPCQQQGGHGDEIHRRVGHAPESNSPHARRSGMGVGGTQTAHRHAHYGGALSLVDLSS